MDDIREAMKVLRTKTNVVVHGEARPVYGVMGVNLSVEPEAVVADEYQRSVTGGPLYPSPAVALGSITLSYRAGELYVIDGQHRARRMQKVAPSLRPHKYLEALCYFGLNQMHEAEAFVVMNNKKRQMRAGQVLNARVYAGDRDAEAMLLTVSNLGLKVARDGNQKPMVDRIGAVKALTDIWNTHTEEFVTTLTVIRDVWPDDRKKWHNGVLRSMAAFLRRYRTHKHFNLDTLLSQLRRSANSEAFKRLVASSCADRQVDPAVGIAAFVSLYNDGRRGEYLPRPHEVAAIATVRERLLSTGD